MGKATLRRESNALFLVYVNGETINQPIGKRADTNEKNEHSIVVELT